MGVSYRELKALGNGIVLDRYETIIVKKDQNQRIERRESYLREMFPMPAPKEKQRKANKSSPKPAPAPAPTPSTKKRNKTNKVSLEQKNTTEGDKRCKKDKNNKKGEVKGPPLNCAPEKSTAEKFNQLYNEIGGELIRLYKIREELKPYVDDLARENDARKELSNVDHPVSNELTWDEALRQNAANSDLTKQQKSEQHELVGAPPNQTMNEVEILPSKHTAQYQSKESNLNRGKMQKKRAQRKDVSRSPNGRESCADNAGSRRRNAKRASTNEEETPSKHTAQYQSKENNLNRGKMQKNRAQRKDVSRSPNGRESCADNAGSRSRNSKRASKNEEETPSKHTAQYQSEESNLNRGKMQKNRAQRKDVSRSPSRRESCADNAGSRKWNSKRASSCYRARELNAKPAEKGSETEVECCNITLEAQDCSNKNQTRCNCQQTGDKFNHKRLDNAESMNKYTTPPEANNCSIVKRSKFDAASTENTTTSTVTAPVGRVFVPAEPETSAVKDQDTSSETIHRGSLPGVSTTTKTSTVCDCCLMTRYCNCGPAARRCNNFINCERHGSSCQRSQNLNYCYCNSYPQGVTYPNNTSYNYNYNPNMCYNANGQCYTSAYTGEAYNRFTSPRSECTNTWNGYFLGYPNNINCQVSQQPKNGLQDDYCEMDRMTRTRQQEVEREEAELRRIQACEQANFEQELIQKICKEGMTVENQLCADGGGNDSDDKMSSLREYKLQSMEKIYKVTLRKKQRRRICSSSEEELDETCDRNGRSEYSAKTLRTMKTMRILKYQPTRPNFDCVDEMNEVPKKDQQKNHHKIKNHNKKEEKDRDKQKKDHGKKSKHVKKHKIDEKQKHQEGDAGEAQNENEDRVFSPAELDNNVNSKSSLQEVHSNKTFIIHDGQSDPSETVANNLNKQSASHSGKSFVSLEDLMEPEDITPQKETISETTSLQNRSDTSHSKAIPSNRDMAVKTSAENTKQADSLLSVKSFDDDTASTVKQVATSTHFPKENHAFNSDIPSALPLNTAQQNKSELSDSKTIPSNRDLAVKTSAQNGKQADSQPNVKSVSDDIAPTVNEVATSTNSLKEKHAADSKTPPSNSTQLKPTDETSQPVKNKLLESTYFEKYLPFVHPQLFCEPPPSALDELNPFLPRPNVRETGMENRTERLVTCIRKQSTLEDCRERQQLPPPHLHTGGRMPMEYEKRTHISTNTRSAHLQFVEPEVLSRSRIQQETRVIRTQQSPSFSNRRCVAPHINSAQQQRTLNPPLQFQRQKKIVPEFEPFLLEDFERRRAELCSHKSGLMRQMQQAPQPDMPQCTQRPIQPLVGRSFKKAEEECIIKSRSKPVKQLQRPPQFPQTRQPQQSPRPQQSSQPQQPLHTQQSSQPRQPPNSQQSSQPRQPTHFQQYRQPQQYPHSQLHLQLKKPPHSQQFLQFQQPLMSQQSSQIPPKKPTVVLTDVDEPDDCFLREGRPFRNEYSLSSSQHQQQQRTPVAAEQVSYSFENRSSKPGESETVERVKRTLSTPPPSAIGSQVPSNVVLSYAKQTLEHGIITQDGSDFCLDVHKTDETTFIDEEQRAFSEERTYESKGKVASKSLQFNPIVQICQLQNTDSDQESSSYATGLSARSESSVNTYYTNVNSDQCSCSCDPEITPRANESQFCCSIAAPFDPAATCSSVGSRQPELELPKFTGCPCMFKTYLKMVKTWVENDAKVYGENKPKYRIV